MPAKRTETARPSTIAPGPALPDLRDGSGAPTLACCVSCGRKTLTWLPQPDGWENGTCRRCLILGGLLR